VTTYIRFKNVPYSGSTGGRGGPEPRELRRVAATVNGKPAGAALEASAGEAAGTNRFRGWKSEPRGWPPGYPRGHGDAVH